LQFTLRIMYTIQHVMCCIVFLIVISDFSSSGVFSLLKDNQIEVARINIYIMLLHVETYIECYLILLCIIIFITYRIFEYISNLSTQL